MDAPRDLKERKQSARVLLAAIIPFAEWLGHAPRTDGDLDTYHRLRAMLDAEARTGITPPWTPGPPMSVSVACLDDENSFFRFDDEPTTQR